VTGTRRHIRRLHALRAFAASFAAANSAGLAVDFARGSVLAVVPAVLIAACLVLFLAETRLIENARAAERRRVWGPVVTRPYLAGGLRLPPAAMTSMADAELGFARLAAVLAPCAHAEAEPVDLLVTGETVAWVCLDCDATLPAGWGPGLQ
jgi:hypothetical protein